MHPPFAFVYSALGRAQAIPPWRPAPTQNMNPANIRAITNRYQDVHLLSLREWKQAHAIEPHDQGGPYIVAQNGYDPEDASANYDEFVLSKSGAWLSVGLFLKLARETRRDEFVFGMAAEVIALLEDLLGKVKIMRPGDPLAASAEVEQSDDLTAAFKDASEKHKAKHASGGTNAGQTSPANVS